MAFISTSCPDDYGKDIKPDQNNPPLPQSLSSIAWSPSISTVFAATFWDGSLKLFEITQSQIGLSITERISFKHNYPALKCTWNNEGSQVYVGMADGLIKSFDINSQNIQDVGSHNSAISSLHMVPNQNILISSGYEEALNFWQVGNTNPIAQINMENKVFASDFQYPFLVAGLGS